MKSLLVIACIFTIVYANAPPSINPEIQEDGSEATVEETQRSSSNRVGKQLFYQPGNPAILPAYSPFVYNFYQRPNRYVPAFRTAPQQPQIQPSTYDLPTAGYQTPLVPYYQAVAIADPHTVNQEFQDVVDATPEGRFLFVSSTVITSGSTTSTITTVCKYNIFTSSNQCYYGK